MKTTPFFMYLLAMAFFFASCSEDELSLGDLPQNAINYIDQNYPNETIRSIEFEEDNDDDEYCYEIELDDDTDLYFDCEGNFLWDDDDDNDIEINLEDLPQSAQDYLDQNHSNDTICEIDMEEDDDEAYKYEVTLQNGLELYFDENGNFLFSEQDDDDEC